MSDETLPKILVTERPDAPDHKAVLETRAGAPDVQVVSMPVWKQVLVRAGRTAVQGFLAVATAIQAVNWMDGTAIATLQLALVGAASAFCYSALQNWLELTAH